MTDCRQGCKTPDIYFLISTLKCGFTVSFCMKIGINHNLDLILIILLQNYCSTIERDRERKREKDYYVLKRTWFGKLGA